MLDQSIIEKVSSDVIGLLPTHLLSVAAIDGTPVPLVNPKLVAALA